MARSNNNNKLKAFVRFDGSGRIVPSSLIVQAFKPKVGNYKEIDAKECCNPVIPTTTTTTTVAPGGCFCYTISNPTISVLGYSYTECNGEFVIAPIRAENITTVCSSTVVTGDVGVIITGGTVSCINSEDCSL